MIDIFDNTSKNSALAEKLVEWGLLATVGEEKNLVSDSQFSDISETILSGDEIVNDSFLLFDTNNSERLSDDTSIMKTVSSPEKLIGAEVLIQLIPTLLKKFEHSNLNDQATYVEFPGLPYKILSKNKLLLEYLKNQKLRIKESIAHRSINFARSASYLGSKASLAPVICEVIEATQSQETIIFDLMCGSGAASGAFSQIRETYYSDAQKFSRLLAKVQSGGMTAKKSKIVLNKVVSLAKENYIKLSNLIKFDLEKEANFLTQEFSSDVASKFSKWASNYQRVGNENVSLSNALLSEISERRNNNFLEPLSLFSRYYANLFFGVKQAAEIDSLRYAIEKIEEKSDKEWALGALICAISACADTYGGHFAQPKFNINNLSKIENRLNEISHKRSISVIHEFVARMNSLSKESESTKYEGTSIEGPWHNALEQAKKEIIGNDVLVYLDPPYTRDEYSRYYHVLETAINYDYPLVSGNASVPNKKNGSRFASEFFTRKPENVESTIVKIINNCFDNDWSCLLSYSSSGLAKLERIIGSTNYSKDNIQIYQAEYSYKRQGKSSSRKKVDEYLILFQFDK